MIDALTFANTGLKLLDIVGAYTLTITCADELGGNRTLTFVTNDGNRQISLSGNLTVAGDTTITPAAATVLNDTTVAAMVDTLGGASSSGTGGLARLSGATHVDPILGTPASGTLTNCTGLPTAGLVDGAVTNAKRANAAANTIQGNPSGSSAAPSDIAVGSLTEETTPALTDFATAFLAAGSLRKVQLGTILGLIKAKSIDNLLFANVGTPSAGADGKLEWEDGELWGYDNARSKWLSESNRYAWAASLSSAGIVTVQYLLVNFTESRYAPIQMPWDATVLGYWSRINGGTVSNSDFLLRKNGTTDILTVNRTSTGNANLFTTNIDLAANDYLDIRLDPKSDSCNIPSFGIFFARKRPA